MEEKEKKNLLKAVELMFEALKADGLECEHDDFLPLADSLLAYYEVTR